MKRKIFAAALLWLGVACQGWCANRVDEIRNVLLDPENDKVLVVAHRGFWRCDAPENSLAAIDSAITAGIDMVELDVWLTRDSVPVLLHDGTLERTTDGKGHVGELTLEQVRRVHLKDKHGKVTQYTVPTLEEALLKAKGRIMVNLDKAYGIFNLIYPVIKRTGTADLVLMKGVQPAADVRRDFGRYIDDILYMPVVGIDPAEAPETIAALLEELGSPAFELCIKGENLENPLTIRKLLAGKSKIWYNTLWPSLNAGNDDAAARADGGASYDFLIDNWGARIIQTDDPVLLLNHLRSRGLHD